MLAPLIMLGVGCNGSTTTTTQLVQPSASVAFADSAARENLCPKSAAGDPMRGLNDTTIAFALQNNVFHWCLPEYHDDQRFKDKKATSAEYGPIAHIFAHPAIDTISDTYLNGDFRLVAFVELEDFDASDLPENYPDLGLKQKYNCFYLKHDGNKYSARVTPPDGSRKCAANATGTGTDLQVKSEKYASSPDSDYPPVGRFVESSNGRPLIGIKCPVHWCVAGPPPVGNVPASAHQGVSSIPSNAHSNVKGWFDDQILGIPDMTSKHKIHRAIRASLIPDEMLGTYKLDDFVGKPYKVVGWAFFPQEPAADSKYAKTFGFSKGRNTIELKGVKHTNSSGVPDTLWYTQVRNEAGVVTKTDIITHRTDHSKWLKKIAATARWRWNDQDEDVWFACDVGCCLANGKAD